MSAELQPSAERRESNQAELENMGNERLKELAERSPEQGAERPEDRAERARDTIARHEAQPEPPASGEQRSARPTLRAHFDRALNFRQTMATMQQRLRPASRQFSKVIHQPTVERVSEGLERTVMRPSVAFGATWTALIVGLIFYLTARHYGYQLSGFEMLAALIVGGLIGIVLEGVFRVFRRRR